MSTSGSIDLTAQCLCEAHSFVASVPCSALPLPVRFCHCTSCRRTTGSLYVSAVDWPGSADEIRDSSLRLYRFSESFSVCFCATCSTLMFYRQHHPDQNETVSVLTGTLANVSEGNLFRAQDHTFVGDTVDGGASVWLQQLYPGGDLAPRWSGGRDVSEKLHVDWPPVSGLPRAADRFGPDDVPIQCHCRGVDLVLRRSDAYFAAMARQDLPFFVEPTTNKSVASFDACNSCRHMFAADIVNWTFSLLRHIDFPDDGAAQARFPQTAPDLKTAVSSLDRDPRLGTLAMYASSPDVQRYFCSRCSASVFYAADDRPELVDLAIGLLDAPDGARAESRLFWEFGRKIGWKEDAAGGWREGLVRAVEGNAEEWRVRRGYPKGSC